MYGSSVYIIHLRVIEGVFDDIGCNIRILSGEGRAGRGAEERRVRGFCSRHDHVLNIGPLPGRSLFEEGSQYTDIVSFETSIEILCQKV